MIDIENAVINPIITTLRTEYSSTYPGLKIYGEYVEYPESFPCVSIWMTDNYTHLATRTFNDTEDNYADVMFTTEVYAVGDSRKAEAKMFANRVDELMLGMGFTRSAMMVLPNADRTAFRITMRHTALAMKPINTGSGSDEELISLLYR